MPQLVQIRVESGGVSWESTIEGWTDWRIVTSTVLWVNAGVAPPACAIGPVPDSSWSISGRVRIPGGHGSGR